MKDRAKNFRYSFEEFIEDHDVLAATHDIEEALGVHLKYAADLSEGWGPSQTLENRSGGKHRPMEFEENIYRVSEFMKTKESSEPERTWRVMTFVMIMTYLVDHIGTYDTGDYLVIPKAGNDGQGGESVSRTCLCNCQQ